VSVGLPQLLAALLVGVVAAFAVVPYITEPFPVPDWLHSSFVKVFVGIGCLALASVYSAFLAPARNQVYEGYCLLTLLLCVVAIIVAARRSERDAVLAYERDKKRRNRNRKEVSDEVFYLLAGSFLLFSTVLAFSIATAKLRLEPYLYVAADPYKNYVLVWTANDLVFLQGYDIKKQEFTSDLAMIKIEKDNDLRMSPTPNTGPTPNTRP
jgi:hypothetical protein